MIITDQLQYKPSIRSMRVLKTTQLATPFRSIIDLNQPQQPTLLQSFENDNKSLLYIYYKEYSSKYLMILAYLLSSATNNLSQTITNYTPEQIQTYYQIPKTTFNIINLVLQIVQIGFTILSIQIIDKYGTQRSMWIANLINILGSCFKVFLNYSIWLSIVGNMMMMGSQCFLAIIITRISFQWFKPMNRIIATSIMSLCNLLGSMLGLILISSTIDQQTQSISSLCSQIFDLLCYTNYLVIAANILSSLLFKDKPSTPPCSQLNIPKIRFIQSVKTIFNNQDIILLGLYSMFTLATSTTFVTILLQLIRPFQFNQNDTLTIIVFVLTAIIVGCAFYTLMFMIFQNYKLIMISNSIILMVCMVVGLYSGKQIVMVICWTSIVGFNLVACNSMTIELGAELAAPVSEVYSCGYLVVCCQLSNAVQLFLFRQSIDESTISSSYYMIWCMFGFNFVGLLVLMFVRQHLKRTQNDILQEIHQSSNQ